MSDATRDRLVRLVRRSDADLAEAALLVGSEADPSLDVDGQLLRVDAIADVPRSRGFPRTAGEAAARELAAYLAGEQGFTGNEDTYHDPDNALLHRVLTTRRGLPITLSIVYVAIARRLGLSAYPVHLPGHVVAAVGTGDRPVLLDPFHAGAVLDEAALARRVASTTSGQLTFRRSMLRPAPAVEVVRRLLNNLTRDLTAAGRPRDALWTVELKLRLPNHTHLDHRAHGDLLGALGRFDEASDAYERALAATDGRGGDDEAVRRAAIAARARLN